MMRGRLMGLGFVLLLALSACATTPAAVPAVYDLSQLSPLRLNVAHVAAADNAVGVSAHAITMMPDLKTRLNNWQQQRLQAAG
ncbi:MAG: hypothetical protein EBZ69_01755, partial [Alphaproteobacteria bacterium]|nr:hypothetical protein [Alphaproteobacteria bacterium]NDG03788.1 hypothetical protein [Alphaproteobacteria bacterium]